MPFKKIDTQTLHEHFFKTLGISFADLALTQPIGHLAALLQSNPKTPFKKNIVSVIKAPYRGIVPAFKAKFLSRSFGLVIGEYCIPKEKNNIKKVDIIKAATAATGIETLFTTTYICQVRILQILKTKPNSSILWQATKQSFSAHATKNIATYLPVFWVKNSVSNDPFYSSALAGITALLVQPITSILDTVMTSHMVSAAQNQPQHSLQTILSKHMQTSSLRNIIATRMAQYGLGYFVSFYIMEKLKEFSQERTTSSFDPLPQESSAPHHYAYCRVPPLSPPLDLTQSVNHPDQNDELDTLNAKENLLIPNCHHQPLLANPSHTKRPLFWKTPTAITKTLSHHTNYKNRPKHN